MKAILNMLAIGLLLISCASGRIQKTNYSADNLEEFVSQLDFEAKFRWAEPQMTRGMMMVRNMGLFPIGSESGRIDILGQSNYLRFANDSVKAHLPYFGERQMGSSYSNIDAGIKFEGVPKDLIIEAGKKSSYVVRFKIRDQQMQSEAYNVRLRIYPNMTCLLDINSTHRFSISYRGQITDDDNNDEIN